MSRWAYDHLNQMVGVNDSLGHTLGYAAVGNRTTYYANHGLRSAPDPYGYTTR